MRRAAQIACAMCACSLLSFPQQPSAAALLNLAGTYTPTQRQKKGSPAEKITVCQESGFLVISRFSPKGKPVTNRSRLDGSIGDYISAGGFHGKAHLAQNRGDLVVEVVENTVIEGRAIPIHMTQHWQLSQNGVRLSIKTDVDCPQDQRIEPHTLSDSLYSCTTMFRSYPITEKYQRNGEP
jgi:hypothetical protein